jgi:cytoskeletal protein CcmA (bactofilin family)
MPTPSGALLSRGVSIKGSVKFLNELLIDGEVEGTIDSTGTLTLGEHARIRGEIRTKSVKMRGTVEAIFSRLNAASSRRVARCVVTSKRPGWR